MGGLAKGVAIVLLAMGVFVLGISLERLFNFMKARSESVKFLLRLRERIRDGKLGEAANDSKAFKRSPVARVIGAGVAEWSLAEKNPGDDELTSIDAVNRALDRVREREVADLRKGLSFLATVASSAPFVGLFGTVIGIITTFQSMKEGGGGLQTVSAGIAEALITTAFGLLVAIVAVWLFNFFTTRVEAFVVDMNDVSSELVDTMLKLEHQGPGKTAKGAA
ncbi:MAG TPA: MotA/TolQ/ExbB proton channel family protein [Polyangia bacterium]